MWPPHLVLAILAINDLVMLTAFINQIPWLLREAKDHNPARLELQGLSEATICSGLF